VRAAQGRHAVDGPGCRRVGVGLHPQWETCRSDLSRPSTLAKADVVRGRTITSYPSVATDLRHSGASWIDQEVIAHGNLIGSRNPDDLPTFCTEVTARLKAARSLAGRHDSRGMGHQEP
jgi:hypothetical protein